MSYLMSFSRMLVIFVELLKEEFVPIFDDWT